jgi:hypothetical protein
LAVEWMLLSTLVGIAWYQISRRIFPPTLLPEESPPTT